MSKDEPQQQRMPVGRLPTRERLMPKHLVSRSSSVSIGLSARAGSTWLSASESRDLLAFGDELTVNATRLWSVHHRRFSYIASALVCTRRGNNLQ